MLKRNTKKNKVLIVEDDEDTREVYSKTLSMKGFDVLCAVNGEDGLEKATKELPDLILLDILMPVMDGFAMLKKLREENGPAKKIPVIMLTNLSADSDDIVRKVAETEPIYYMVKAGLPLEKLVEKVKQSLDTN